MRVIFYFILFSCFCNSCKAPQAHFNASLLKLKNTQINTILDTTFILPIGRDQKGYMALSEQKISVIQVEKSSDTVRIRIRGLSFFFLFEDDMFYLRESLYGAYEYRGTLILIFGENASCLFDKMQQSTTVTNVVNKERVFDSFSTGWYDYYIIKDRIYFDKMNYAL